MKPRYYILRDRVPTPVDSLVQWATWFERRGNRRVAETQWQGTRVSTVFLGLDHAFRDNARPELFETMVFGPPGDADYQTRCSTWEEAEHMHRVACARFLPLYARIILRVFFRDKLAL